MSMLLDAINRIARFGVAEADPKTRTIELEGRTYIMNGNGSLTECPTPNQTNLRPVKSHDFADVDSWARYLEEFEESGHEGCMPQLTTCIADPVGVSLMIQTCLDYHGAFGRCEWNIGYRAVIEPTFRKWMRHAGGDSRFTQRGFAEFLEDRAEDIVTPKAADVIAIARSLRVSSKGSFSSDVKAGLQEGSKDWREEIGGKNGSIPDAIEIAVPIVVGHESRYKIKARIYASFDGESLQLWYTLANVDQVVTKCFESIIDEAKALAPDVEFYMANG